MEKCIGFQREGYDTGAPGRGYHRQALFLQDHQTSLRHGTLPRAKNLLMNAQLTRHLGQWPPTPGDQTDRLLLDPGSSPGLP